MTFVQEWNDRVYDHGKSLTKLRNLITTRIEVLETTVAKLQRTFDHPETIETLNAQLAIVLDSEELMRLAKALQICINSERTTFAMKYADINLMSKMAASLGYKLVSTQELTQQTQETSSKGVSPEVIEEIKQKILMG